MNTDEHRFTGCQEHVAKRLSQLCLPVILVALLAGCAAKMTPSRAYFGPTETMAQVVQKINANNQKIPTLWSRASYEATVIDPDSGKETFFNGDGKLQYRGPSEFRFIASKEMVGLLFDIGVNQQVYWLTAPPPGPDRMWKGTIGKPIDPKIYVPIRPELVMQVLAVGTIGQDFLAEPFPGMRFNSDDDSYMFTFCRKTEGRYIVEKEVWYDRKELTPKLVVLFDADGRVVLRAYLSKHKPMVTSAAESDRPVIATAYDLFFPLPAASITRFADKEPPVKANGSQLHLKLEGPKLTNNNAPNDFSFRFMGEDTVSKVIQIDAKE